MTIQIMRPVVNLNTGEVYQSVSAAAQRILSIAQGS